MKPVVDRLKPGYTASIEFTVYNDVNATSEIGEFATSHGVRYVPTMVVVSADGRELNRMVGALSEAELRAKLDAAK